MTRDDKQSDGADNERKREDDAGVQTAELFEIFSAAGQPEKQAHLATNKTEVDGGEDENLRTHQCPQVRYVFGTFKFRGFGAQRRGEGFAFGWRKPARFGGEILAEGDPDAQPEQRQSAFGHEHDAPAPVVEHPRSEEHTSELQSRLHLVCRLLLEKKK